MMTLSSRTPHPPAPSGMLMEARPATASAGTTGPSRANIATRYSAIREATPTAEAAQTSSDRAMPRPRMHHAEATRQIAAIPAATAASDTDFDTSVRAAAVNRNVVADAHSAPSARSGEVQRL